MKYKPQFYHYATQWVVWLVMVQIMYLFYSNGYFIFDQMVYRGMFAIGLQVMVCCYYLRDYLEYLEDKRLISKCEE